MAVAFLVPLAWIGIDRLQVNFAERPDKASAAIARESSSADLLLVGWTNAALEDVRVPLLQERLLGTQGEDGIRRGGSPYIASATTPVDRLRQIIDQGVSPDVAYNSLVGSLIGPGKLNVTLSEAGRVAQEQTIRTISDEVRTQLGVELRVSPRTIPFFPEEGDKLFEAVSVKIPDGIPTDVSSEHDIELTWDGIHDPASLLGVQKVLGSLVGYPTAEFPQGVPLVKAMERRAGLPVALEIRLSPAGLLAPAAAIGEIRERAALCRIPSGDMLFVGATVSPAAQHQGMLSALAAPLSWGTTPAGVTIPVAAIMVLAGVLLAGLRSPRRVLISLGLTSLVLLLAVGGFGLARVPFDTLAAGGFLGGTAASLALLLGASVPSTDPDVRRQGTRSATLVLLVASAVMMVAPSPSLRAAAAAMTGMIALTFALLESNILPLDRANEVDASEEASLLLTGPGRWIGRGALGLAAFAAAGLWFARPDLDLGRQLAEMAALSKESREANDFLAGTNLIETRIRFDRSAQERLRFLERMELIRGIEADLRQVSGVTGVYSAADLHPSRTIDENASTRERVTFNRLSKTTEEKLRGEKSPEIASLLSFGATSKAAGESDEVWTIQVRGDATAGLDGLLKRIGTAIPQKIRLEPGVHHQIAGAPLARAAQVRGQRIALIVMLAVSCVAATVIVSLLLADLPAALAVTVPSDLCQAAVLGGFALAGKPLSLLSILSCNVTALVAVSASMRILGSARQRMRGDRDAATALQAALAESSRTVVTLAIALASAAMVAGWMLTGVLEEVAFVAAAGLIAGVAGTLLIVPVMVVGRLDRIARPSDSEERSEVETPAVPSPLRRSA